MPGRLPEGIYEHLIDSLLEQQLGDLSKDAFESSRQSLEKTEAPISLTRFLGQLLPTVLRAVGEGEENKTAAQVAVINEILASLARHPKLSWLRDRRIIPPGEVLTAIVARTGSWPSAPSLGTIRPSTPLNEHALFTGAHQEPSLESELRKEIASADRIDFLVSFIKWSGLRLILEALQAFCASGRPLRVMTTAYLGATDLRAVTTLAGLPGAEILVSYDGERTRLHAKAYLFHRNSGCHTAIIGSANLSRPAITSGLEWNVRLSARESPDLFGKVAAMFESYLNSPRFARFRPGLDEETLRTALLLSRTASGRPGEGSFSFDIRPYPYQQEILDRLQAARDLHGRFRNLLVAATGTGKTIMAAFDYARQRKLHPDRSHRLLFVAHRQEILAQSLACFRGVLRDADFGQLLVGSSEAASVDHLFVSIQKFNARALWDRIPSDFYDMVIVDEFHHGVAPSYRALLEHFRPRILLGLTATPERHDGLDITEFFEGRITQELRLPEAIEQRILCPFHYFGVTDSVDLRTVPWVRGRYEPAALEQAVLANAPRLRLMIEAIQRYLAEPEAVTGLAFCVSVAHAQGVARALTEAGLPSLAITARTPEDERARAVDDLRHRRLRFLCSVDVFNEGVDLPAVDTVLFLRPTESLTVFLQQLGRGLRLAERKECLTVLDFVGNAHREFQFAPRFRALLGREHQPLDREIEGGFPHMLPGCSIHLERGAQESILENIRAAVRVRRQALIREIQTFTATAGQPLTFEAFLAHRFLQPVDLYDRGWSWFRLLAAAGLHQPFHEEGEEAIIKGMKDLCRKDSLFYFETLLHFLEGLETAGQAPLTEAEQLVLVMFASTLCHGEPAALGIHDAETLRRFLKTNPVMTREFVQLLRFLRETLAAPSKPNGLDFPCPLEVHCSYFQRDIFAALGVNTMSRHPYGREGVKHVPDRRLDLFLITLEKSEGQFSPSTMYQDYAINETLFHWQSQSTTAIDSPTARRYIEHDRTGHQILLFVRLQKKIRGETQPYLFLGKAHYVSHSGSRPVSFIWRLEERIPPGLLPEVVAVPMAN
ncbi:MAG: DUF3427 domain-containing protein [Candidatus Riflebacteria bacterium]|nr:DUF3427 domain-containing protein [Candidatus Riflebacteria bacterium]